MKVKANDVFSTGQAAYVCRVSQQSIIRSFDKGLLKGFRVPLSRFRRVPAAELRRFMEAANMPTDLLDQELERRGYDVCNGRHISDDGHPSGAVPRDSGEAVV